MRPIDAHAFEANMQNEWERCEISNGEWIRFREMINDEPTIDAVEVVRCKDCRWYKKWKTIGRDDGYCGYARMTRDGLQYINTNADDFCSYGERSE